MPNLWKRLTRSRKQYEARLEALAGDFQLLGQIAEELVRFERDFEQAKVITRNQEIDRALYQLNSYITTNEVNEVLVKGLLMLESKAVELGLSHFTEVHISELVKVAQEYEKVEGLDYEGFKQDKEDIKSYRERLEKFLENLPSGSG